MSTPLNLSHSENFHSGDKIYSVFTRFYPLTPLLINHHNVLHNEGLGMINRDLNLFFIIEFYQRPEQGRAPPSFSSLERKAPHFLMIQGRARNLHKIDGKGQGLK